MAKRAIRHTARETSARLTGAWLTTLPVPARWRRLLWHLGGLLLAIAISGWLILQRDQLASLSSYGYLGVFLVSLASSATVLLPAPGLALVFAAGDVFNPLVVGLVAGLGETLGELVGYLAGVSGRAVVEERVRYQRMVAWLRRYGLFVIFALAAIPNPTFDLAGIAAGALRFPLRRFVLACCLGKLLKNVAVAFLGAESLGLFVRLLQPY